MIAFLGTGIMGLPMACNLLRSGLSVRAWNRTRIKAEPLADEGATICYSPAQAVENADIVITMLFDADAVLDAMSDAWAHLAADAVWVQMSTVGVQGCRRLAGAAREHGLDFVDAPVLGTRKPAEEAKLKIFAAGPEALRDRVEPVLAAMGNLAQWFGEVGQASALKMVVNAWVLALTDGTAASIALARALGLDPKLFLDVIAGGPTDSPYAHVKAPMMIRGRYEPASFALSGALKDATLILDAAEGAGIRAELMEAIRAHLQRAADAGHDAEDMAAVYEAHGAPPS